MIEDSIFNKLETNEPFSDEEKAWLKSFSRANREPINKAREAQGKEPLADDFEPDKGFFQRTGEALGEMVRFKSEPEPFDFNFKGDVTRQYIKQYNVPPSDVIIKDAIKNKQIPTVKDEKGREYYVIAGSGKQSVTEKPLLYGKPITYEKETQPTVIYKINDDKLLKKISAFNEGGKETFDKWEILKMGDAWTSYINPEKQESFKLNILNHLKDAGVNTAFIDKEIKVLADEMQKALSGKGDAKALDDQWDKINQIVVNKTISNPPKP
jgi:hypothetical protein